MTELYPKSRPLYTTFAWAYDKIVQRPVKERAVHIHNLLIKHHTLSGSKILDAGCGPGLYTSELAKSGYRLTGIDLSREQIETAKKRNTSSNVELFEADIFSLDVKDKYDVVFCRGVLNDIIADHERDKLFNAFSQYLKPGGLFLADVRDWERSRIQINHAPVTAGEFQSDRGLVRYRSEKTLGPEDHEFTVLEQISLITDKNTEEFDYRLKMKCWTEPELRERLRKAGFTLIYSAGDYDPSVEQENSVYIVFLAKKI